MSKIEIDDFIIPGSMLEEHSGEIYKTLLSMDLALNGGIPEGISVLISGAPKIGKTTFSLHFAGQSQAANPDKKVFFFDCEGRLRPELLSSIKGLDMSRFFIIRSNSKKVLTAEDYLNLLLTTLKDNPKCICILDSIASLVPEKELSSEIGDSIKLASTPTLMYRVFRATSQILPVTQSTFIGLTHLVANPNPGPGKKSMAVGGNAIRYGASVHLEAAWKEDIKAGDKNVGQIAHMKVIASALGPPGADVKVPIVYGKGVDIAYDTFNVALELGLIEKGGSWFTLPTEDTIQGIGLKEPMKLQGANNIVDYLNEHPEVTSALDKHIRNMMLCK